MLSTVMSEAFARAGVETPRARANRIVRDAVERCGGNRVAAIGAMTRALLDSDAETVWAFFAPDHDIRLHTEYDRMLRQIREERGLDAPRSREGQLQPAVHAALASAPSREGTGSGHAGPAQQGQGLVAATRPYVPTTIIEIARNSLLRSIEIDGRPIGECTAGRVREWARARGREARFAYLLAHGLQDSQVIGMCKTEDDAREAQRLAQQQVDNG
jgi:hypothetical protein